MKMTNEIEEWYYDPNFLPKKSADNYLEILMEETPWQQKEFNFGGKPINMPRLVAWYGDKNAAYKYSGIVNYPLPWTSTLLEMKWGIEDFTGHIYNSVLLNYYRDGNDSISFHSDDEPELGEYPNIASVSLGAEREFIFMHKGTKAKRKLILANGSLVNMYGECQKYWQHSVPKTKKDVGPRINLTFRNIVK